MLQTLLVGCGCGGRSWGHCGRFRSSPGLHGHICVEQTEGEYCRTGEDGIGPMYNITEALNVRELFGEEILEHEERVASGNGSNGLYIRLWARNTQLSLCLVLVVPTKLLRLTHRNIHTHYTFFHSSQLPPSLSMMIPSSLLVPSSVWPCLRPWMAPKNTSSTASSTNIVAVRVSNTLYNGKVLTRKTRSGQLDRSYKTVLCSMTRKTSKLVVLAVQRIRFRLSGLRFFFHVHVMFPDLFILFGSAKACPSFVRLSCFLCFVSFFHLPQCLLFHGGEEYKPYGAPALSRLSLWFCCSALVVLTFSLSTPLRLQRLSDTVAPRMFEITSL